MRADPVKEVLTVLTGLCMIFAEISSAQSIGQEIPVTTADFLSWCKSIDTSKRDFCEGFIEGTAYNWKVVTACQSSHGNDQSFCAGSIAAREKIDRYRKSFTEDGDPYRWQQFNKDVIDIIGDCSADNQEQEHYCQGFNLQLEIESIAPGSVYLMEANDDATIRGIGEGVSGLFAHLYGLGIMHFLRPCIPRETEIQDMINKVDKFTRQYPELVLVDSPTLLLTKAFYYELCPGPVDQTFPHMEHCVSWESKQGSLVTENNCGKPINIQFKTDSGPIIEGKIDPGKVFDTKRYSTRYIFTACHTGYISSIPFSVENWEAIRGSNYHCVKQ